MTPNIIPRIKADMGSAQTRLSPSRQGLQESLQPLYQAKKPAINQGQALRMLAMLAALTALRFGRSKICAMYHSLLMI